MYFTLCVVCGIDTSAAAPVTTCPSAMHAATTVSLFSCLASAGREQDQRLSAEAVRPNSTPLPSAACCLTFCYLTSPHFFLVSAEAVCPWMLLLNQVYHYSHRCLLFASAEREQEQRAAAQAVRVRPAWLGNLAAIIRPMVPPLDAADDPILLFSPRLHVV
jgi:hypothetical protein